MIARLLADIATATAISTTQPASSGLDPGFLLILCLVAIVGIVLGGMLARARDARIAKKGANNGTNSR